MGLPPSAPEITFLEQQRLLPNLQLSDGEGHNLSLADFRGRPVVLNLWATWCVPCRTEMPTFDHLQALVGASALLVVPLSIDSQGAAAVRKFYEAAGVKGLGIYLDRSGQAAHVLDIPGVPTTLIIDRDGREIGRKIGPADWFAPEIVGALREHLGL